MNKQQKLILCFIIGILFFFLRFCLSPQKLPHHTFPLTWKVELLFFNTGTTAQELISTHRCKTAVNGSYFDYDGNGTFLPAGIWVENGEATYHTEPKPDDVNLRNVLHFQSSPLTIEWYFDQANIIHKKEGETWIFFNAWPRLLKDASVNEELPKGLSHRSIPTQRTILAQKESQTFLLLFKEKATLKDLAEELRKQGFDRAVNLDGGPSSSFASETERFNSEKILPIFFCIN